MRINLFRNSYNNQLGGIMRNLYFKIKTLLMGKNKNRFMTYYNGKLYDVKYYPYAMTPENIAATWELGHTYKGIYSHIAWVYKPADEIIG